MLCDNSTLSYSSCKFCIFPHCDSEWGALEVEVLPRYPDELCCILLSIHNMVHHFATCINKSYDKLANQDDFCICRIEQHVCGPSFQQYTAQENWDQTTPPIDELAI